MALNTRMRNSNQKTRSFRLPTSEIRKKYKNNPLNFKIVFHWIFHIHGLDFCRHRKSGIKTAVLWLGHVIPPACFFFMLSLNISELFSPEAEKERIKMVLSHSLIYISAGSLWCCLRWRQKAISQITSSVSKLRKKLGIKPTYGLANVCVLFAVIFYGASLVSSLYPFTEEAYAQIALHFHVFATFEMSANAIRVLAYLFVIIEELYATLFSASFVSFYVILCHDFQSVLSRYARKLNKAICQLNSTSDRRDPTRLFIHYCDVISALKSFESIMSLPVFISFSFSMLILLLCVLAAGRDTLILAVACQVFGHTVKITAMTFAASGVNESDKVAKEINLECLETLSKLSNRVNLRELPQFERMTKSPAFTLSGWGVFRFTKSFFFSAIGCLVTYSLLIKGL